MSDILRKLLENVNNFIPCSEIHKYSCEKYALCIFFYCDYKIKNSKIYKIFKINHIILHGCEFYSYFYI